MQHAAGEIGDGKGLKPAARARYVGALLISYSGTTGVASGFSSQRVAAVNMKAVATACNGW